MIYNYYLVVYKISTPYITLNQSYELEKNDGSNGTWMIKRHANLDRHILYHPGPFWPIINLKFITFRWKMYLWSLKILHCYIVPFIKYFNLQHHTLFETPDKFSDCIPSGQFRCRIDIEILTSKKCWKT